MSFGYILLESILNKLTKLNFFIFVLFLSSTDSSIYKFDPLNKLNKFLNSHITYPKMSIICTWVFEIFPLKLCKFMALKVNKCFCMK